MGVAKLLLANKADVNAKDDGGQTPLHGAAAEGHKDVVELLVANKAEINAETNLGATPLALAARYEHSEVMELLRRHGSHE
jgi:ankyrin repeat protein